LSSVVFQTDTGRGLRGWLSGLLWKMALVIHFPPKMTLMSDALASTYIDQF